MKTCIDGNVNHNTNNNAPTSSTITAAATTTTATATIIPKTLKSLSATENICVSSQQHHLVQSNLTVDNMQTLSATEVPLISNVLRYRCSSTSAAINHGTDHSNSGAIRGQINEANMTSNLKCLVRARSSTLTPTTTTTTTTATITIIGTPTSTSTSTSTTTTISTSISSTTSVATMPTPSTSSLQQAPSQTTSPFKFCKTKLKILRNKSNFATAATTNNNATTINDKFAATEEFHSNLQPFPQCDTNCASATSSVINMSLAAVRNGHVFNQDVNVSTKANHSEMCQGEYAVPDNTNATSIREYPKTLSLSLMPPINTNKTHSIMGKTITKTMPTTSSTNSNSPESPHSTRSWYSTTSTPASTTSIGIYLSTSVHVTSNLNDSYNSGSSSSVTTPTTTSSTSCLIKTTKTTQPTTTTTTPATLSPRKASSISGLLESELLQWQDMPQYLQFNPYVLKGYRPLQTFNGCLLSLFYWHNETINILTHAIPIVYILAIVPGLMPWDSGYRFLSFCHVFGSVAPWCGSFVYHLFMNIEHGENAYYTLLKLDMVGIWVTQSFGALPLVTATTYCFTQKWKWFIIASYCAMSLWGLYKALTASSPWQRRLCFALPFTMRSILTFLRTLGTVGGNHVALPHVYLQDAVSLVGGAIGAMRIPEKWFPGLVDFYLNSHNIMHVLVVVAVYSMHKATIKDFEWMSSTTCDNYGGDGTNITANNLNIEL